MERRTTTRKTIIVIVLLIFLGLTYSPMFMTESILDAFAREDHIYEGLTSLYLLITSFIFFIALIHFRKENKHSKFAWIKTLSFLGLAFLFFVAAGEEISWGERIFGFEHNLVNSINVQEEFNLHNLKYFHGDDAILPFSIDQLGIGFLLMFAFLIPLINYFSRKTGEIIGLFMPIMPLSIGILIPANYIYQKFLMRFFPRFPELYLHPTMKFPQAVYEIREHGYAFAMLMSAVFFLIQLKAPYESKKTP